MQIHGTGLLIAAQAQRAQAPAKTAAQSPGFRALFDTNDAPKTEDKASARAPARHIPAGDGEAPERPLRPGSRLDIKA